MTSEGVIKKTFRKLIDPFYWGVWLGVAVAVLFNIGWAFLITAPIIFFSLELFVIMFKKARGNSR